MLPSQWCPLEPVATEPPGGGATESPGERRPAADRRPLCPEAERSGSGARKVTRNYEGSPRIYYRSKISIGFS